MGIISARSRIWDARRFFEAGQRAMESVVRISSAEHGVCTAWAIHPQLLLAPSHAFEKMDDLIVHVSADRHLPIDVAWRSDGGDWASIAVLQLRGSEWACRPLRLRLQPVLPDDDAFLIHFPHGQPVAALGQGRIRQLTDQHVDHDADTQPGSGGAPVFDAEWQVLGTQFGSLVNVGLSKGSNRALAVPAMLDLLRQSPHWSRIADAQEIATSTSVVVNQRSVRDASRMRLAAAVRWRFDPDLVPEARALLAKDVVATNEPLWTLRPELRILALKQAGTLEAAREARGADPADGPEQRVLDRILSGESPVLSKIDEVELPLWMPAARWFSSAGLGKHLPDGKAIQAELDRRRRRHRLQELAGRSFSGRVAELARLERAVLQDHRPVLVHGIGGAGKSALVAQFLLSHPKLSVYVWLDFDRSDVAPDDAPTLLAEVWRQLAAQVSGLGAVEQTTDWQQGVEALGAALRPVHEREVLLVLDSFETAQYEDRSAELWPFLSSLAKEVPGLRVIVSGRAAIGELAIVGKAVEPLFLGPLEDAAARAYLCAEEITDEETIAIVVELARGLPMNLRLAVELLNKGDSLTTADLPRTLTAELIEGHLYRRVLNRIGSELAREVAHDALVLRRITRDMLVPVLGLEVANAARAFDELGRELALLEGTEVLRHRPDVRTAVLPLLEAEDLERVRKVERKAIAWYERSRDDDEGRVELVYHLLRLGDLDGAKRHWTDACAARMGSFAVEELREPARGWLRARLRGSALRPVMRPLGEWEADAAGRVRDAIGRGLWRLIPDILGERSERSLESPLGFLESYVAWKRGDVEGARELLRRTAASSANDDRNREILGALIFPSISEEGRDAIENLVQIEREPALWEKRPQASLERLAVLAGHLHGSADLDSEAAFAEIMPRQLLLTAQIDFVLPWLQERTESLDFLRRREPDAARRGWAALEYIRSRLPTGSPLQELLKTKPRGAAGDPDEPLEPFLLSAQRALVEKGGRPLSAYVALLRGGLLRATVGPASFLGELSVLLRSSESNVDVELSQSVVAASAVFVNGRLLDPKSNLELIDRVAQWTRRSGIREHPRLGWAPAIDLLYNFSPDTSIWFDETADRQGIDTRILPDRLHTMRRLDWLPAVLFVLSPSPLERLVDRLVEYPG